MSSNGQCIFFLDIAAGYVPLANALFLFFMLSVLSGRGLGANGACLQLQNYVCLTGTNTKLELLYIQILHDVTRLCTFFPFSYLRNQIDMETHAGPPLRSSIQSKLAEGLSSFNGKTFSIPWEGGLLYLLFYPFIPPSRRFLVYDESQCSLCSQYDTSA